MRKLGRFLYDTVVTIIFILVMVVLYATHGIWSFFTRQRDWFNVPWRQGEAIVCGYGSMPHRTYYAGDHPDVIWGYRSDYGLYLSLGEGLKAWLAVERRIYEHYVEQLGQLREGIPLPRLAVVYRVSRTGKLHIEGPLAKSVCYLDSCFDEHGTHSVHIRPD